MYRYFPPALLLSMSLVVFAQTAQESNNSATQVPAAAAATHPTAKPADYSQEPFVVEKLRTAWRFENDGTGQRETTMRVKIQTEAGVRIFGQVAEGYSAENERLDVKYVRVLKADGSVVTAGREAVQDLSSPVQREAPMYSDFKQKHIVVPGLRPGDTLEFQTALDLHKPWAPGNFWTQYDFNKRAIVLDEELEIDVPRARELKLKTGPGFEARVSQEGDRRIYRWTSSNLKRDDDETDSATGTKKKKRIDPDKKPDVELSTFTNWQDVGRWYAELQRPRLAPDQAIADKAKSLTTGKTGDLEKIEAIYDYVSKSYRYVSLSFGMGHYQPHAAAEVLKNDYGDCKDKHTLLASLLSAAGYQANAVLINSWRKLDPDVPSPSQFDHVITQVQLGHDALWLDTTPEVAPFRMLARPLRNKLALVIPQNGAAELQKTPVDLPFENTSLDEFTGSVDDFGKLTGTLKLTLRGDAELLARSMFQRYPKAQWKAIGNSTLSTGGIKGETSDIQISDITATREPFIVIIKFTAPNYIDWSKKDLTIPIPMARGSMPVPDEEEEAKTEPYELPTAAMVTTQRVRLELPKQFTVRLPLPVTMKRDYAELSSSYKMDGQTIVIERTFRVKMAEIARDRLPDFTAFARATNADSTQRIGLENLSASSSKPTIPTGAKPEDLFQSAQAASRAQRYDLAIPLYQKVIETEPKHKYAWNNLGMAQFAVGQYDAAIASYKRAIENDRYDAYAYNNLGRVYWAQHRYDDAITAFKKQIEVNPLDRWAHANLGMLYAERRQYADAVQELDKAISITPDNPALYIYKGEAHLGLGDDAAAMAAFDRALEKQPSPQTWNNVAYQLAKHNVHLDRARRYAESAVASAAALLRNASSSTEPDQKLAQERRALSLAMDWDTLGWIYFLDGNIDTAEKYVRSSWVLCEHGEVAYHLGRIYEKRGDTAKAAAAYAAALTTLPAYEEARPALERLVTGKTQAKQLVEKARQQAIEQRTIRLTRKLKQNLNADFDVTFTAAGASPQIAFVSGSDQAKEFLGDLQSGNFDFVLPDNTPTRIVRNGTLSCSADSGDCKFVLTPVSSLPGASAAMRLAAANEATLAEAQPHAAGK